MPHNGLYMLSCRKSRTKLLNNYRTMNEVKNIKKHTKKVWSIAVVMHRTWKILLISGILGLITELIFMIVKLAIVGNQTEGRYAVIWFASSMLCLVFSGVIVVIIYSKPYLIQLRDWVYGL